MTPVDPVPPAQPEICICAAVLFADGRIVRGHRHDSCFRTAEGWTPRPDGKGHVQGFITSRNRFVDREEGAQLQDAAGIVSAMTGQPIKKTLFSEDLYFESHDHTAMQAGVPPAARPPQPTRNSADVSLDFTHPEAPARPQPADPWQSIETAPKDGPILAIRAGVWAVPMILIWLDGPGIGGPAWRQFDGVPQRYFKPTHWMTLPKFQAEAAVVRPHPDPIVRDATKYIVQAAKLSGCSWKCYSEKDNPYFSVYCSLCQNIAFALLDVEVAAAQASGLVSDIFTALSECGMRGQEVEADPAKAVRAIIATLYEREAEIARLREPELRVQAEDARMGHVRIDECFDGDETKGQPLYDRIGAKFQKHADEMSTLRLLVNSSLDVYHMRQLIKRAESAESKAEGLVSALRTLHDSYWDQIAPADRARPDYTETKFCRQLAALLADLAVRPQTENQDTRVADLPLAKEPKS